FWSHQTTSRSTATARCVLPAPGFPRRRRPCRMSVPARNSFAHWRQTPSACSVPGMRSKVSNEQPAYAKGTRTFSQRVSARASFAFASAAARQRAQYRSAANVWPSSTTCSVSNSRPQPRQRAATGPLLLLEAGELGIAADEGDVEGPDRAVAVLGDDHL